MEEDADADTRIPGSRSCAGLRSCFKKAKNPNQSAKLRKLLPRARAVLQGHRTHKSAEGTNLTFEIKFLWPSHQIYPVRIARVVNSEDVALLADTTVGDEEVDVSSRVSGRYQREA